MADGRVKLQFVSTSEMRGINQISDGVKKLGRTYKDFGDAGSKVVSALSARFSGELTTAMGGAFDVVKGVAQGGIWGALAAAAGKTIDYLVERWNEAEERTKRFAEVVRAEAAVAMDALGLKIADVSTRMKDAEKDAEGFVKALNGKVESQAKYDVARLHVETLQRLSEDVTEAGKAAILADEAYEAGMIKATAAVEQAANIWTDSNSRRSSMEAVVVETEARLHEAEGLAAKHAEVNAALLGERADLQRRANESLQELIGSGMSAAQAQRYHAGAAAALADFESQHADLLRNSSAIEEGLSKARAAHAEATAALAAQDERIAAAGAALETAELARKGSELDLAARQREAAAQLAAERSAREDAEIAAVENMRQLEWQNRIYDAVRKDQLDAAALLKRLNELMEEGCEDEEIRHELALVYNDLLKRKNEAEKKNVKEAEADAASGKTRTQGGASASVAVSIGTNAKRAIGEGVSEDGNWQDAQKQARAEQRKQRDEVAKQRQEIAPMARYLRGDMPRGQKALFEKYMTSKYGPDQVKAIGKAAMDAQLLSKSEAKRQQRTIIQMAAFVEKALSVR